MWEFSWPEMFVQPLAKLWSVRWVGRAVLPPCVESTSGDSSHSAGDQSIPFCRAAPSKMLLHPGRTCTPKPRRCGRQDWHQRPRCCWISSWNVLLQYRRLPQTTSCFPPFPKRLKNHLMPFPVIHLLKCLCQFSGERNKITRTRVVQWGKNYIRGKWSWKRGWNPVTALSCLQSFVLLHFKEYKRECLLWEKGCKTVTLLCLDCLPHTGG